MEKMENVVTDRLIRRKELVKMVGYSASSIWRRCKDGSFPLAVRIGPSAVAWRLSEVEEWMNSRQTVR
ncbi:MAG: AlpA family phage regulatory protein [Geobacteraceae bacterium]|nr:AlpA family phage regulatory protein [Geobacteraceae bacterium]